MRGLFFCATAVVVDAIKMVIAQTRARMEGVRIAVLGLNNKYNFFLLRKKNHLRGDGLREAVSMGKS